MELYKCLGNYFQGYACVQFSMQLSFIKFTRLMSVPSETFQQLPQEVQSILQIIFSIHRYALVTVLDRT